MAGPISPPSRTSSLRSTARSRSVNMEQVMASSSVRPSPINKNTSERSLSVRPRRTASAAERGINMRRYDGAARRSTEWDGLRRDPELWVPDGNCYVYLYGKGQSQRGPAFRLPMQALIAANCGPLLDRFLADRYPDSPVSDSSSNSDGGFYGQSVRSGKYELYIPAPATSQRDQSFLYHSATRNFFAWVLNRSLIGTHLGGALVGLLNSMNEFRSIGVDNVQSIMDYMDEEGYADLRNTPDHALGQLYFAEHFQFRDLWIDAFAHCTGMYDRLITSNGFEFMSRQSRALITRSRIEMETRLQRAGTMLSTFLSDDLSAAHLGLSMGARTHLDKFRSFLNTYYVLKLGYYPPESAAQFSTAFPKNIYGQMCSDFQKLYNFLVDTSFTLEDSTPSSHLGGICVLQSVRAFDARHKYAPLQNPLPLLPEDGSQDQPALNKRLSWNLSLKGDKMKPDPRLVTLSSLAKATNTRNHALCDCSLVRAYKGFEKDCVFSSAKSPKGEKLSLVEARKVRWLLIYSILQTLLSVTRVPEEVHDTTNVPYSLCVQTAGCPSWKEKTPYQDLIRSQTDQAKKDFITETAAVESPATPFEVKPDIDYRQQLARANTTASLSSRRGTIRRALSSLGQMPELSHPKPSRHHIHHEILVHGYGNGSYPVSLATSRPTSTVVSPALPEVPITRPKSTLVTLCEQDDAMVDDQTRRKLSLDTSSSTNGTDNHSSRWSASVSDHTFDSPRTSIASSRRGSEDEKRDIKDFLERPLAVRLPSSVFSAKSEEAAAMPSPLQLTSDKGVRVTTEVTVESRPAKMYADLVEPLTPILR